MISSSYFEKIRTDDKRSSVQSPGSAPIRKTLNSEAIVIDSSPERGCPSPKVYIARKTSKTPSAASTSGIFKKEIPKTTVQKGKFPRI